MSQSSESPQVVVEETEKDQLDNQEENKDDEHKRLGGYSPLSTLIRLSPGPLISQFVNSLYGVVDSMWVSRFIGEIGLTALSLAYIIDNSAISFGFFISTAASSQISYLFSHKAYERISHLTIDLMKAALIFAMIVPTILFPVAYPLFKFLGGTGTVNKLAFDYIIPLLSMNLITCLYHCICGVLQAEGRTWTYGAAQISSMILNMALWDPLLLYLTKRTLGSSLATEISMLIPASIILILLFCGKFSTKPNPVYFFKCFSKDTWLALKTGLSAFIMNISISLPSLIMQKFIAIRANRVNQYDMIVAVYNALCRIYTIALCVPMALNAAYLPATSYAFGRKDYKRILRLTWHIVWISITWGLLVTMIVCIWPKEICMIWSRNDEFLYWSKQIVPISFYSISLTSLKFIVVSLLQASQKTMLAAITSFTTELGILPIMACIFHFTGDPNSPEWLFYAYPCSDAITTLCSVSVSIPTLIHYYRESKKQNNEQKDGEQEEKNEEESDDLRVINEL